MCVDSEVDLGLTVTSKLSWNQHIILTVSKADKMLGLLRGTCSLLTNRDARRTLYLHLMKSQMCYATEIWSPFQSTFKINLERIQRRATRWILQVKIEEPPTKIVCWLLIFCPYVTREIKDLTFFFKAMYGHYDLNVFDYVSVVVLGREVV